MGPKLLILFYVAAISALVHGTIKVSDDLQRARLPEFLTELDLASLEASQEDIESLKKVVKRLAPAKNGEYLMYQVFFGNEELLKEWLKGAGVLGQPGVDFPVLTTIPPTKFSCRGLKGGYYADLETNCQVFHICDNGRKISFLCPNGTIFQQSQLICDWWFKVDCGKSAELYEQSAEQLAEEDRKRAEARKMNSEFHRTSDKNNGQIYYQTQNQKVDYDGRQNGRTNPFGQNTAGSQEANSREIEKENGATISQENGRNGNQFGQGQQAVNHPQTTRGGNQYNQHYNHNQQSEGQSGNDQQSSRQNFNNNYNTRNGATKSGQNSQDYSGFGGNSNAQRDDKASHRSPKFFGDSRSNFNEYTSTANPFKEYQQPAESAAFATSRNNRYNKSFQYNQFGSFYSPNLVSTTEKYQNDGQGSFGSVNGGAKQNLNQASKNEAGGSNVPSPTFAPIYKAPTTGSTTATYPGVTTQKSYVNTDVYRHNTATQTPYSNSETATADPYQTNTRRYEDTSEANYQHNSETPARTYSGSYTQDTRYPSTQKPYVNTDTYRQSGAGDASFTSVTEAPTTWTSYEETGTTSAPRGTESFAREATLTTERYTDNYDGNSVTGSRWNTVTEVTPGTFDVHSTRNENNAFGESTQRPYTGGYQESVVTSRNLRPYDTSFTYKYGKIGSTLGPYVPFTKNYAYTTTTTTTTRKPPVYTATVPTLPDHRKSGSGAPTTETPAYYQTGTTPVKGMLDNEREHVIGMLHSLQELESTAPTTEGARNGSRIGLNIPPSSGPSTLHTLALYFATASDNFDSNETSTDTAVRLGNAGEEEAVSTTENSESAELPTSLLTQHTINSYADLFNINSALQPGDNTTTNTRIAEDEGDYSSNEDLDNDLDIQQSQGPVTGDNQRNNPKLRELAQVFTHALSAYLQDPDTFRKVLTEIRPTEPPATSATETTESTTLYPTTQDDYPSATKEKDEVLDFSDVTKASRRTKLTTPYPTTGQTFTTPSETTIQNYYTTSGSDFIDESLNEAQSSDFRSSDEAKRNDFAHEVNHAFRNSNPNELQSFDFDVTGPSAPQSQYDSYVPIGPASSRNRFGGFQNNSAHTPEPYGKGVRPADATPIGNNYVPESTPATYARSPDQGAGDFQIPVDDDPLREFGDYRNADNSVTPGPVQDEDLRAFNSEGPSTATTSTYQDNEVLSTTRAPFRINYYESPTKEPRYSDESLVTAGSVYSTYRNGYNDHWGNDKSTRPGVADETTTDYPTAVEASTQIGDNSPGYNQQSSTNHWTASPTVTRLWETTVFLDPKHINQGLTASGVDAFSTGAETYGTTPVSREEILVTDASGIGKTTQYGNTNTPGWRWTPNENDSPTAFTLLPNVYSTENTATPAPAYTTHSSIVTTITSSSVSSSAKPVRQPKSYAPRVNVSAFNVTENEIVRAQEMFGNLNATSTDTLMKVMKQADSNSTVRQLVLLLISHCKGPMNKTMEEEKEQLLDALLRMPVNEFSTDESRDIIDGINKLQLPIGRSSEDAVPATVPTTTTTTTVSVTTYRSRKGRKFRPSAKGSASSARPGDGDVAETANSLSIEAGSPSDNRALELLRSLYTIAAKWG